MKQGSIEFEFCRPAPQFCGIGGNYLVQMGVGYV